MTPTTPSVRRGTAAPGLLERVRSICAPLPETREEAAWAGTRWVVRGQNFAHVVHIDAGWPPAYAKAAGSPGPLTVLTFRSPLPELNVFAFRDAPYFKPVWFADIVGMVLDASTDWDEVADLVVDSYCMLAPKKLTAQIGRAAVPAGR